jgi:hypothetical protein
MSEEASDITLGELTHRRARKDALSMKRQSGHFSGPRNGCRNAWEKVIL